MIDFEFDGIEVTEFGVGVDEGNGSDFVKLPVDGGTQDALREMALSTWRKMDASEDSAVDYSPGNKYASMEYVFVREDAGVDDTVRRVHSAGQLRIDGEALDRPEHIFCYFARFIDAGQRRLTAVRRATHFKGVLKATLIRFVSDSLKLVEDRVFRLDHDFDMLVDSSLTHILRPSAFEFVCGLRKQLLAAVSSNVASIRQDIPFVEFSNIEEYASTHPRAARYLASIRAQRSVGVEFRALRDLCRSTGVEIDCMNGMITVAEDQALGFLEVLDRRRYQINLIRRGSEQFRASNRRRIDAK